MVLVPGETNLQEGCTGSYLGWKSPSTRQPSRTALGGLSSRPWGFAFYIPFNLPYTLTDSHHLLLCLARVAREPIIQWGSKMLRCAMGLLWPPTRQQLQHIPQIHGVRVAPLPPPRPPPSSPAAASLSPLPPSPPSVPPTPPTIFAASVCRVSPQQQQNQTLRPGPYASPHHGVLLKRAQRWGGCQQGAEFGGPACHGWEHNKRWVTQREKETSKKNAGSFPTKGGTCYSSNGRHRIGGDMRTHTLIHPPRAARRGASPWWWGSNAHRAAGLSFEKGSVSSSLSVMCILPHRGTGS